VKLPTIKKLLVEAELSSQIPRGISSRPDWTGQGPAPLSPAQAATVLRSYEKKLNKLGIKASPNMKRLGGGKMGFAYDLGDSVLKLTRDKYEANAAKRIEGKKLRNVYEIYAVYELNDSGIYVIHQEKLNPLGPIVKKYWGGVKRAEGRVDKGIAMLALDASRFTDTMNYDDAIHEFESIWAARGSSSPQEFEEMSDAFTQIVNGLIELKKNKISSDTNLVLDFSFFTQDENGAKGIQKQLSENYKVTIAKEDEYWHINGTSRPYAVNLTPEQHLGWVEFMHDVALSYGCVFSVWSITEPKENKVWSSEDIETEFD